MVNLKMKLQNKLNSFFPDAIDSEILILGTGPTLRKGMQFVEKTNFQGTIISLKQSYLELEGYSGKILHLVNPWNYQRYIPHKNSQTFTIYIDDCWAKFKPNKEDFDWYLLTNYISNDNLKESVLANFNFEKYYISNQTDDLRPLMPGIFAEALYIALALKVKKIHIFGVDYNRINNCGNTHFYDKSYIINKLLKVISKPLFMKKAFNLMKIRTEYSHASLHEQEVAIPGITNFINYIEINHKVKINGWMHRKNDKN